MQFYQLISNKIADAEEACVALLGGGGKTALLHKLANEFAEHYAAVLQTSLTKTAFHPSDKPHILNSSNINRLDSTKNRMNPMFIIGEKINNDKLLGISEQDLYIIKQKFDITIFECDGARNKPLKAHTEYDSKVPEFATHTIIIIGADVVNTKIQDGLVHRPELFCKKWNVDSNFKLDVDFIAKIVTSKDGYLAKVEHNSKIVYFVNKFDEYPKNSVKLTKAINHLSGMPTFYGSLKKNIIYKI